MSVFIHPSTYMAMTSSVLMRTFFNLPAGKSTDIELAEQLANLRAGHRLDWSTLLASDRILIISEAGMGKTYECQRTQQRLWDAGLPAFFIELAGLGAGSLEQQFSEDERQRFASWKAAQTERAYFFLDSIDELKLTPHSFSTTLKQFANTLGNALGRACVVLTTRPTTVDRDLAMQWLPVPVVPEVFVPEEHFANVAMSIEQKPAERAIPEWRFVALSPLDTAQMRALAITESVTNPDALLAAIQAHHAHDFAKRPLDFLELCSDWKSHGRIRAHRDQVDTGINIKLRPRADRREQAQLPPRRAREGAARLALAALLTRKLTIWHSNDHDRGHDDTPLDPAQVLEDWSPDEVKTLLERPLFGFASYGRVRFHNRSIIEFLAAERLQSLVDHGLPIRVLKRLLFATPPEGQRIVKPYLQPVAAWLAPRIPPVCAKVLEHAPDLLLRYGDPELLPLALRTQALERYVEMYGAGGWRGQHIPNLQIQRLASNDLAEVVQGLWTDTVENPEVREILLELIGAGQMTQCADIAYTVATRPENAVSDRLHGLLALAQLKDARLPGLLDQATTSETEWPEDLARAIISNLFPEHLSVAQLLAILGRLSPRPREIGGAVSLLPQLIANANLNKAALETLQQGLMHLIARSCAWRDDYYRVTAPWKNLAPALMTVARLQLEQGLASIELFDAIALAALIKGESYHAESEASLLTATLDHAQPSVRAGVFWAHDRLVKAHHPKDDLESFYRIFQFQRHGAYPIDLEKDTPWILKTLSDDTRTLGERQVALELALHYSQRQSDRVAWLKQVAAATIGAADLETRAKEYLDAVEHPRPPPAWLAEDLEEQKKARQRQARDVASWQQFWRELDADPESAFSEDRIDNTCWNLWRAMEKDAQDDSFSGWNRGFIERVFGRAMADRFRTALAATWRKERPTLKSERPKTERNSYLMRWRMGLAGLYAEAEDPAWGRTISAEEADLACRYALLDLRQLPPWLEAVIEVHPSVVDAIIGKELSDELDDAEAQHAMLLQDVARASPAIISFFIERIRLWLKNGLAQQPDVSMLAADKTRRAAYLLLSHGTPEDTAFLEATGLSRLQSNPEPEEILFWLPVLMRLDPAACLQEMEALAAHIEPAQRSAVTAWFSTLFERNQDIAIAQLEIPTELLLRFTQLAYRHIKPQDDIRREGGAYTPNDRDHAERSRDILTNALLNAKGPEAWAIKMQFATDPSVAHFRDRVRAVALEKLAEACDALVLSESDVVQLERQHDFTPGNRVEMAALLEAKLMDIEDLLHQDASPRELWATISAEKLLRRELAGRLEQLAHGAYLVNQEAVTGDEKETDIRLSATGGIPLEAVIELKIGENGYTFTDLQDALHTQLIGKYMAPEHRRVGCLLISLSRDKQWEDPTTKKRISFEQVIARLEQEAKALAAGLGYGAYLTVKGLDLRSHKSV